MKDKDFKNTLVCSYHLRSYLGKDTIEVIASPNCREDRAYLIDDEGHVHTFDNLGRLMDNPIDRESDI